LDLEIDFIKKVRREYYDLSLTFNSGRIRRVILAYPIFGANFLKKFGKVFPNSQRKKVLLSHFRILYLTKPLIRKEGPISIGKPLGFGFFNSFGHFKNFLGKEALFQRTRSGGIFGD